MSVKSSGRAAPVWQQQSAARAATSAVRALRSAREALLLTMATGLHRA